MTNMKIIIMLTNGKEISVECDKCETEMNNLTGALESISVTQATDKRIMYLNLAHVDCVYRVFESNETSEKGGE